MMKIYKVTKIEEGKIFTKRARIFKGQKGLELTEFLGDKEFDYFMYGNEVAGYVMFAAYVYLMTDGKDTFIVVEEDEMLTGEKKADRAVCQSGEILKIMYK